LSTAAQISLRKPFNPLSIAAGTALYVGGVLNAPIIHRRLTGDSVDWRLLVIELLLILSATFSFVVLASFNRRAIFRLIASLLIVLSATGAYYIAFYNVVIGHGIVESVFTTEMDLIGEILDVKLGMWVLMLGLGPTLLLWRLSARHRSLLRFRHSWKDGVVAALVLMAAVLVAVACTKELKAVDKRAEARRGRDIPGSAALAAHRYLPTNWMSGLGMSISEEWQQRVQARNLVDPGEQHAWSAPASLDDSVIVLVIGESARWDHMSALGYDRPTTPLIAKEPSLVAMRGQSCNTATALSLRCMFVRPESIATGANGIEIQKEDNVFSVFKHLGFSIDLFAMQAEVGFYNKTHADRYKIREVIAAEAYNQGKPVDDILLVREMQDSIKRWEESGQKGRHLVVLHTKGSHYLYSNRYPRNFAAQQPECLGSVAECSREQLINSYDNSLLYTDYVLHSLIDSLRDKKAFLFYVSDHGESIDDNLHLHGTPKAVAPKEQFAVPFLLWFSDRWLADGDNKGRFEQLKKTSGETRRHAEIFDSLLGCAGIASPDGGITARRNWCQSSPISN
jgi:KDO II ethanolaminephosphotransferase